MVAFASAFGGTTTGGPEPLRVGAKTFTEQLVLAEILSSTARDAGAEAVEVRSSLGSTVAFDALEAGDIDVYVDYSGTLWANVLHHDRLPPRDELARTLASELRARHGVEVIASLGFENAYALAMREDDARERHVTTLAELGRAAPELRLGVDYELLHRGEWSDLVSTYHLRFADTRTMDPGLLYDALASRELDVASVYTTDGRIAALHLRTLADPAGALPPYDAVVLARRGFTRTHPRVAEALRALDGRIDASAMRRMNAAVDRDGRSPREVAAEWAARPR